MVIRTSINIVDFIESNAVDFESLKFLLFFKMRIIFVFCAFAFFNIDDVSTASSGAPVAACFTLSPNHLPNSPQTGPSGVTIQLSSTRIRPGQTITVTISRAAGFRGFIVQGRNVVAPNNAIGTMVAAGDGQVINCSGPTTATHVDNLDKTSVTVTWTAPAQGSFGVRLQ